MVVTAILDFVKMLYLNKEYVTDVTFPSNMVTIGWMVQTLLNFVFFQDGGNRKNVIFDQIVGKYVTDAFFLSNMVTIG